MNFEDKEKSLKQFEIFRKIFIVLFSLLCVAGMVIGFLLFLRPTVSELEKRELRTFPEFSLTGFLDGSYESDISTWYADTYPGRETLLRIEQRIKTFYGFQSNSVQHTGNGDDIPDIPDTTKETETKETTKETENATENTSKGTEETESPSEQTESETPETTVPNGQEIINMNPQEAGSINILNNSGYCVYGFNLNAADKYCEDVATLRNAVPSSVDFYQIMVPNNSAVMLSDAVKAEWNLSDERKVIDYYFGKTKSLASGIIDVPVFDLLRSHNEEYLYFRTDHHWTQLGAYYTYRAFCEKSGQTAHELSEYPVVLSGRFVGSYFTANGFAQVQNNPDEMVAYTPIATNDFTFYDDYIKDYRNGKIVRNMSEFNENVKYMGYIYGDNPFSIITNPSCKNGKKCVLIKESFGNCFVPFLVDHYEEIYVVDYRGYKEPVSKLVAEKNITDVIFLNNLEAISDTPTMNVLGNICK